MWMPYVMNWSAGLQDQISGSWLTEALYQGSSGVGLLNNWDINVVPLNISSDPTQFINIRNSYQNFRPYRLGALLLKAIRLEYPEYELWHRLEYEYETGRLAIDLLSGGTFLRDWVDNLDAKAGDFEKRLAAEERTWTELRRPLLIY